MGCRTIISQLSGVSEINVCRPAIRLWGLLGALGLACFVQAEPAEYGEAQVLIDYTQAESKLGHLAMGPVTRATDRYFEFKSNAAASTGINWLIESAPQYQVSPDNGWDNTANNETNLIAQWAVLDPNDAGRGNLLVWYQISSTWGGNTTSDFQDDLAVLSPPNGGDTAPGKSRDLAQHIAWEQKFSQDRWRIQVGKLTSRVLMNLNRYAVSDREDFFTPMIVNNPTAHYTARIGLGAFVEYSRPGWYASAMVRDADADLSKRFADFSSLDSGNWEYVAESGLKPDDVLGLGAGNYRVTVSYSDATSGTDSTSTVSLSFDQDLGERLGAYLRFATADDTFRAFERRIAMGVQLKEPLGFRNDRVGIGYWWGSPTDDALRSESGLDLFWKLQVARFLEASAGLQVIFDPAFDTTEDTATVAQARLRFVF